MLSDSVKVVSYVGAIKFSVSSGCTFSGEISTTESYELSDSLDSLASTTYLATYFSSLTILAFNYMISISCNSHFFLISAIVSSLLILALFFIALALYPNLNVEVVSSSLSLAGEQVMIKAVLAFPPRDSYNTLVNLLSL